MIKLSVFLLVIFFLINFRQSSAQLCLPHITGADVTSECDYCQCSQGISPLETGSTGIRFDVRSLYRGAFYKGSEKQPNPDNIHETYMTDQLMAFYKIGETGFTASLFIPYVSRRAEGPEENIKESGISDVVAMLTYNYKNYIDGSTIGASLSAGIKFASGNTAMTLPSGEYIDPHIRPGTGTTDIIIGTAALWSLERLGLTAALTFGIVAGGVDDQCTNGNPQCMECHRHVDSSPRYSVRGGGRRRKSDRSQRW